MNAFVSGSNWFFDCGQLNALLKCENEGNIEDLSHILTEMMKTLLGHAVTVLSL